VEICSSNKKKYELFTKLERKIQTEGMRILVEQFIHVCPEEA
jgi:hypothetical protein